MQSYSVRDIERVLRLSRSTIRGLIDVGFVTPSRGPRREYRFSFQDLIVLRAARALIQAKVSRRRIRRSLEDLRKHLPSDHPTVTPEQRAELLKRRVRAAQRRRRW